MKENESVRSVFLGIYFIIFEKNVYFYHKDTILIQI